VNVEIAFPIDYHFIINFKSHYSTQSTKP